MENIKNEFMLARLAMAIDCEGSIMIGKYKRTYFIKVSVYNTNERLIDWMVANFGFSKYAPNRTDRPNYKQVYMAHMTSNKAEKVLWGIKPYLIIKDTLADLALALQDTMSWIGERIPEDVIAERERLWLAAKELNKRGKEVM